MSRLVISNISQFAGLVEGHPSILHIPAFYSIKQAFNEPVGNGCNKCARKKNLAEYRTQFEAAMSVLSDNDKAVLKKTLGNDDICFYRKEPNGQLKLHCL